jgi:hypothetical protein
MSQNSKNERVLAGELQYHKFINTYSGGELLKKHSLDEEGLWQIKGEDPNCDWGGSHHQPNLGIVDGKLVDVIKYAVELSGFWSWGAGGNIVKIDNIKKVDSQSARRRKDLEVQKFALQKQLDAIDEELNDFGGDAYV